MTTSPAPLGKTMPQMVNVWGGMRRWNSCEVYLTTTNFFVSTKLPAWIL